MMEIIINIIIRMITMVNTMNNNDEIFGSGDRFDNYY